jgi:hypothetical protein
MSGAIRTTVQITVLRRAGGAAHAKRAFDVADSGCESGEDRIKGGYHLFLAANHQAIAAFQSMSATAGANVDVMYLFCGQFLRPTDVVHVVGVSTINDDVAGAEQGCNLPDHGTHRAGGHHEPNGSWLCQFMDQVLEGVRADRVLGNQLRYCLRRCVENNTFMSCLEQPTHHIRAHSAESYHSDLHETLLKMDELMRCDRLRSICPSQPTTAFFK